MPLTAEERAAINRQNARKSTGPKTEEGKAASRRNATTHGLRAEALSLPNEDPTVVAARSDAWNDYYRPQSPAAQHLVNQCVAATLMADRCGRYHEAALAKQVREAKHDGEIAREETVNALAVSLKADPATAIRRLAHTADGCRWLIGQWERLLAALDDRGQWTGPERDQAIRLLGFRPEAEALKECPEAWLTRLFAILCHESPSGVALEWMFQSHHYPDLYRGDYRMDSLPEREDCQQGLREMVQDKLEPLRVIEDGLRQDFETPDLAGAADRALILHDGPSARLFLRYHAEARTAFHRAHSSLVKTLELDAAGGDTADLPALSPNEPSAPSPAPAHDEPAAQAEAVSPNEADPGVLVEARSQNHATSGTSRREDSRAEGPGLPDTTTPRAAKKVRAGSSPAERRVA